MTEDDKPTTAFLTPDELYELNVMPFGLCNAPQRSSETVLRCLKCQTGFCCLDDIVVFGPDFLTHLHHLRCILTRLTKAGRQLHLKKCLLATREFKGC